MYMNVNTSMNDLRKAKSLLLAYEFYTDFLQRRMNVVNEDNVRKSHEITRANRSMSMNNLRICYFCSALKHENDFDILMCSICDYWTSIGDVCEDCVNTAFTYHCDDCKEYSVMREHKHPVPDGSEIPCPGCGVMLQRRIT
jgi:hypothetical protein